MTIIFYDFPSKNVDGPWNPNTWKTRYTLNYKGIPYKTELVEYVDIEKLCKEKGIPPSSTDKGAMYHYSLPSILDTSTGTGVSESHRIAEYLDKAYPDTPKVIPPGTEALQAAWIESIMPHLSALWQFTVPRTLDIIDHPESNEYFYRTRCIMLGKDLKQWKLEGSEWEAAIKDLQKGLDGLDQKLVKSGGPYVMGKTVSFADFTLAGWFKWLQICVGGKNSKEWQLIASWNEGRWAKRLEDLERYEKPQ
ncbi:hypothetical protein AX15_001493 [Amanita polypyramis BW_CC]|nr:hypothetical protein AX15_001493 [Amanita polypyramis BW_CC]